MCDVGAQGQVRTGDKWHSHEPTPSCMIAMHRYKLQYHNEWHARMLVMLPNMMHSCAIRKGIEESNRYIVTLLVSLDVQYLTRNNTYMYHTCN